MTIRYDALLRMQLLSRLWNCTAAAIAHLYFRSAAAVAAAAAAAPPLSLSRSSIMCLFNGCVTITLRTHIARPPPPPPPPQRRMRKCSAAAAAFTAAPSAAIEWLRDLISRQTSMTHKKVLRFFNES